MGPVGPVAALAVTAELKLAKIGQRRKSTGNNWVLSFVFIGVLQIRCAYLNDIQRFAFKPDW